jgi:ABC-2 type transport system ATP-binding protein
MLEADQLCQRIAIMDHGKILVNDAPAELKKLIPGGNSLELHVETSEPARLNERFGALPGVTKVEEVASGNGEPDDNVRAFHVYAAEAPGLVGAAAQAILDSGARVRDISVRQATLEEVFIYLTGRHLR